MRMGSVRRGARRAGWALLLCLTVGRLASAQENGIAISGVVTTRADGLAVPGAAVSLVGLTRPRQQMRADGTR